MRFLRSLYLLAVLVGILSGIGAVVFRGLIALFHNLFFLGRLSAYYDANIHTPAGPWGVFVILVPVLGGIGVVFLVKTFAPEARGHGVPEVMDAVYYNKGLIRPVVAVIKAVASALSIGSGGSVGREGPIIQIGASLGSAIGQILRIPAWQRTVLIAAGTAGGIGATFNTPIGGLLFATEMMLYEVSARTLVPVAIAAATATYVGQLFFGSSPSFDIPGLKTAYFHVTKPVLFLYFAGLGLATGAFSAVYVKSIYIVEDFFDEKIGGSYYRRHIVGMLLLGVMIYLLFRGFGHYYVEGVGYSTIQEILSGKSTDLYFLFFLCILKLLATCLTLGSGGSGGIFSPSLFMGAALGGGYGLLLHALFPHVPVSPPAFAVAGMAAVFGGATGAALTAIVMILEMTLDYSVIIPLTLTVAVSYAVRKRLLRDSIYTMKLSRRGHRIPESLRADFLQTKRAMDVMNAHFLVLPAATGIEKIKAIIAEDPDVSFLLAEDPDGNIAGLILPEDIQSSSSPDGTLGSVVPNSYTVVSAEAGLTEVGAAMTSEEVANVLVTDDGHRVKARDVKGLIRKQEIETWETEARRQFAD